MSLFNPDQCKRESVAIAHTFQALIGSGMRDDVFDGYYENCQRSVLSSKAIDEIERTVILSKGRYRPIDVYKFDIKQDTKGNT